MTYRFLQRYLEEFVLTLKLLTCYGFLVYHLCSPFRYLQQLHCNYIKERMLVKLKICWVFTDWYYLLDAFE